MKKIESNRYYSSMDVGWTIESVVHLVKMAPWKKKLYAHNIYALTTQRKTDRLMSVRTVIFDAAYGAFKGAWVPQVHQEKKTIEQGAIYRDLGQAFVIARHQKDRSCAALHVGDHPPLRRAGGQMDLTITRTHTHTRHCARTPHTRTHCTHAAAARAWRVCTRALLRGVALLNSPIPPLPPLFSLPPRRLLLPSFSLLFQRARCALLRGAAPARCYALRIRATL